jgi:hypothetical protein
MSDDVYMTPQEAAAYLKTSTSTLAKRRIFGGPNAIPFSKSGKMVRYRKSDLDAHMAENRRRTTSDAWIVTSPAPAGA